MITNLNKSHLISRHPVLAECEATIVTAVNILIETFESNNKLLICGNGGSAADSDHISGELNKGFLNARKLNTTDTSKFAPADQHIATNLQYGLPTINLTSSSAFSSAYGNDIDWSYAFAQHTWAVGKTGDTLLAISTSGNSKNIVYAAKTAKVKRLRTIALTGASDSLLAEICDITVQAPANEVHHIQELHLPIYHSICIELETHFFQ